MDKLVISDDEGHTTVVPLLRDEISIGRQEGNAIRLTERNVSRTHARLLKRNGSYIIEDLGSYNGVSLNGKRIDIQAKLVSGDQLSIGDYDLKFQSDVAATSDTMPAQKARSQPPPRLVLLSEPAAGAEFTLNKRELRIGRDERLDIWIDHKSISHEHAELRVDDGAVTVFDLESANGIRVNGVKTSRAVLEAGDVLELGQVRFRFLPPQGAHSLEPLPLEEAGPSPSPRKPLFAISLIGLLVAATAGAVLATMRGAVPADLAPADLDAAPQPEVAAATVDEGPTSLPAAIQSEALEVPVGPLDADVGPIDEPQEWEGRLTAAQQALASGDPDRAYAIANELPPDSVLRETPEFGEIRYRFAQALIDDGERALAKGAPEQARAAAEVVLELPGITSKQLRDARRLMRTSRNALRGPKAAPNTGDSTAQTRRIVD
ncbi:MAG: FHA domain-containing protein [Polyangiales bacterium]